MIGGYNFTIRWSVTDCGEHSLTIFLCSFTASLPSFCFIFFHSSLFRDECFFCKRIHSLVFFFWASTLIKVWSMLLCNSAIISKNFSLKRCPHSCPLMIFTYPHQRYWFWLGGGSQVFSVPLQGWAAPILSNNSGVGHWKPVLKKKFQSPPSPRPVLYDRSVITMCNPIKRWYARHFWVLLQAMFMNDWNQTAQRLKLQERLLIINKRNIIRWRIYRDNNFHSRRQVFKFFLKSWVLKLNVSVKSKL